MTFEQVPNKETEEAIAELEAGGGKKSMTVADLMADLNSDKLIVKDSIQTISKND